LELKFESLIYNINSYYEIPKVPGANDQSSR